MDPITAEDVKRSNRIKQVQSYESSLEEVKKSSPLGKIRGKSVKNLESKEETVKNVIKKIWQPPLQ